MIDALGFPAAGTPVLQSPGGGVKIAAGDVADPILDLTQTWSNASVPYTAIKTNITNSQSAAGSLLMDWRVNDATLVKMKKSGQINFTSGGSVTATVLGYADVDNYGIFFANGTNFAHNGVCLGGFNLYGLALNNTTTLCWRVDPISGTGGYSVVLLREADGILAQRNVTTQAQVTRVYNTWTDASNYERFAIDWQTTANVCLVRTSAAGSGTLRGMSIQQATGALSFYGATPVTQPASADQAAVVLGNADSEIGGLTISATYDQTEVQALRDKCEELADDVRALSTLVHSLRTALVNLGAIKGAV